MYTHINTQKYIHIKHENKIESGVRKERLAEGKCKLGRGGNRTRVNMITDMRYLKETAFMKSNVICEYSSVSL